MTLAPGLEAAEGTTVASLARLLRERDQLMLLYEALAEVERARSVEARLRVLTQAIRRMGYGRVDTVCGYTLPPDVHVAAWISKSIYLDSGELIVPVRAVDGATVATLVVGAASDAGPPVFSRVRTVELFAQQVASIIENARLFEESERQRRRAEEMAERHREASDDERRARAAVAMSESRYRNLFESATDAIYTLDVLGFFTSVNEATCLLAGRPREELLGRGLFALVATNEAAALKAVVKSVVGGTPRQSEYHFVKPDGTRRIASITVAPIRHGMSVIGVLGIARDVTDEREGALALERSEMRYARLVDAAADGIFTVDAQGKITSVNRSLEEASGHDRTSLLGTPFAALADSRDETLVAEALRDTFAGKRRRIEVRYTGIDNEPRYSSLTLTPIVEGESVTAALGVVRDMTEEKRLTEQLMQQEKLAAVGQLVSGVAHELNNPLASVMAFAQLLSAADPDAPADRRAVDAIEQEAKRAAKIVSNLLTFARQHQPERRIADLNRVVDDTLELRRYALRNEGVDVEVALDPDLPLAWADPFQLQQVVLNLVTNAEHALSSWEGARRIRLTTARSGAHLVIRVADSGPGIAPEHVDRIFNPFFTTKPVGEGTGLGLSISDGIVREHGGRIRVESEPGAGAAFIVEIPYTPPPEADDTITTTAEVPRTPHQRLLFVDDEGPLRQAVTAYFRSLGHEVDAVGSGRDALALLSSVQYDTLLLDLRLQDMSGEDVLRELRAMDREPRRVVFITGDTQSDSARRVLEASGHPAVCKPFLLDELAAIALAEAPAQPLS